VIAPLTSAEHTTRQFAAYERAAAEAGAPVALPHALMREIEVGDTAESALAGLSPYQDHVYRVQYAPERTGMTYVDPETGERRPLRGDDPFFLSRAFVDERWAIGTADECAERISSWLDAMRIDRLIFQPKAPGRPLADAVAAMTRVVAEVRPRLRALRAGPQGGAG
jgi:alkanesulfonate monooxygenase SsuD/methylene tetrahydromethanopterin reductase-like flavin-dependent oxidoreductase (luciferase family)